MKSKESIQKIKDFKVVFSEGVIYPFEDYYYKKEIATIEKDLEILEILKGKVLLISDLESINDFEKVKGWLYDK